MEKCRFRFEQKISVEEFLFQETKNGQSASNKKSDGDTSTSSTRKRAHESENNTEHGAFMTWFTDTTGETGNDEFGEVIKDDIFVNPLQYYLVRKAIFFCF